MSAEAVHRCGAEAPLPRSHECQRCGRAYAIDAWRALPALQTLSGADVSRHLVAWPSTWRVEVRACVSCGHRMARTAR